MKNDISVTDKIQNYLHYRGPYPFNLEADELLREAAKEIDGLILALHDAIRRPMGVVPESAERWYSQKAADDAENRRMEKVVKLIRLDQKGIQYG